MKYMYIFFTLLYMYITIVLFIRFRRPLPYWLGIRIMFPNEATCLATDCCFIIEYTMFSPPLAWNRDNVSEWSNMSSYGLLFHYWIYHVLTTTHNRTIQQTIYNVATIVPTLEYIRQHHCTNNSVSQKSYNVVVVIFEIIWWQKITMTN